MTPSNFSKLLLPEDNLEYKKPQVDQFIRANKEHIKTIGVVGFVALLAEVIALIKKYNDNKHEEEILKMSHEEKMMELEIELKRLEKED